jgi:hypothetical protein
MGIKDGTEFNPTLKLTPLYTPSGEPVKRGKERTCPSGAVSSQEEEIRARKDQIALHQKMIKILEGMEA